MIRVEKGILPNEYSSLGEATHAANDRKSLNKIKCNLINGYKAIDYRFDGTLLSIKFENRYCLKVFPGANSVSWDIIFDYPSDENSTDKHDIIFEFSNGDKFPWEPEETLESLINEKIAISPSDQYLFLFLISKNKEHTLSTLIDKDNPGNNFLVISES